MDNNQKERLAAGRVQAIAVRNYLNHIAAGPKPSPSEVRKLEREIAAAQEGLNSKSLSPLDELNARTKIERNLNLIDATAEEDDLVEAFVEFAPDYVTSKNIHPDVFRAVGVNERMINRIYKIAKIASPKSYDPSVIPSTDEAIVEAYLDCCRRARPKRGRTITDEEVQLRIDNATQKLQELTDDSSPIERIALLQERHDLSAMLSDRSALTNARRSGLERAFKEAFPQVASEELLSPRALSKMGVPQEVLDSISEQLSDAA